MRWPIVVVFCIQLTNAGRTFFDYMRYAAHIAPYDDRLAPRPKFYWADVVNDWFFNEWTLSKDELDDRPLIALKAYVQSQPPDQAQVLCFQRAQQLHNGSESSIEAAVEDPDEPSTKKRKLGVKLATS